MFRAAGLYHKFRAVYHATRFGKACR